jgi:bifunctional DNase/RNase
MTVLLSSSASAALLCSPPASSGPPEAADGSVEVQVAAVVGGSEKQARAVLLVPVDSAINRVVPVVMSSQDAESIDLRLRNEPGTGSGGAEQLASVIRELGGVLVRVEVDGVEPSAPRGRLRVSHQGRLIDLDASGPVAIALSLDTGTPLFVDRATIEAGVPADELALLESDSDRSALGDAVRL